MSQSIGGKSIKFSSSPITYEPPPPALPYYKQSKEFLLTMMMSHLLLFNGEKITKIETNEDDSHGKPDTKIVLNEKELGIQITKISLNDPLRRINISERQTNELLNLFPENLLIEKPINIYIYLNSKDKNNIPKGSINDKKKLVYFISDRILKNKEKLFGENPEIVHLNVDDPDLNKLAHNITLNPINSGSTSLFKGKDGIHINYEFDSHEWDEQDLIKEIDRIIHTKQKSIKDLLLIWGDRFELLYQDKQVAQILNEKFSDTGFHQVYFLTFFDRVDMFLESWQLFKIK